MFLSWGMTSMRAIAFVVVVVVTLSRGPSHATENERLPSPSAVICLRDIKYTATRVSVDAEEVSPELVTCEIGISNELNESPARLVPEAKAFIEGKSPMPATAKEFKIVVSALRVGEPSAHVIFPVGISKVDIGFVADFKLGRGNRCPKLSLDIRPRFKLPSGGEYPFTEMGHKNASRSQARRAQDVVYIKEEMFRLLHFGHNMGRLERYRRYQQLDEENRRLQTSARRDEEALDSISKYWVNLANNASVYVRFVVDRKTLPAEVGYVK
jgi:hypothetical protein